MCDEPTYERITRFFRNTRECATPGSHTLRPAVSLSATWCRPMCGGRAIEGSRRVALIIRKLCALCATPHWTTFGTAEFVHHFGHTERKREERERVRQRWIFAYFPAPSRRVIGKLHTRILHARRAATEEKTYRKPCDSLFEKTLPRSIPRDCYSV